MMNRKVILSALVVALTQLATGVYGDDRPPISRIDEADLESNPDLRDALKDRGLYNDYDQYNSGYADAYGYNFFTDTAEAEYDGYQQAWRYLGWYVACGTPSDRYDESGSGSQDSNDNGWSGSNYCQRYLMWAGVSGWMDLVESLVFSL
jgi:hypothetical protein